MAEATYVKVSGKRLKLWWMFSWIGCHSKKKIKFNQELNKKNHLQVSQADGKKMKIMKSSLFVIWAM